MIACGTGAVNSTTLCAFRVSQRRETDPMFRAAHLIVTGVALLTLCGITGAEARHHHGHHHFRDDDDLRGDRHSGDDDLHSHRHSRESDRHSRESDPRFYAGRAGVTFGVMLDQSVRDCGQEVMALRTFPVEQIARTIAPDSGQQPALESLGHVANETADTLMAGCPDNVPDDAAGRLDAAAHSLDAVGAAVKAMQPPMQAFYKSLRDEQKALLVAKSIIASGDTSRGADTGQKWGRTRSQSGDDAEAPKVAQAWDCGQWEAQLRAWPIAEVEGAIPVWPRQRAAFYELAASFQHAADALADTCLPDSARTPDGRMAQKVKNLDAVRQSIAIIRPALVRFDAMLDGGQRRRFHEAV
jgi:LTXXQ motif family protein